MHLKPETNLIGLVAEANKLAIQVNFIHCDAPTRRGMLADTGLSDGGPHRAGGLTVIVIETALLAARGISAAGGGGAREEKTAGVTVS